MVQASKTFRIFVSSTFSDLKEERNVLQENVFPRLRDLCMENGCGFQAIDLRWGVSEEAALDQQTMKICFEEIDHCQKVTPKPNFIVLLGDRYGWIPLPYEIPADEFEEILNKVPKQGKDLLVWDEDWPEKDFSSYEKGWYRKDENAVPSVYCLKPRHVDYPKNASDKEIREAKHNEANEWGKTEEKLKTIIKDAIEELGWAENDERRFKYEASATEQEIIKGVLNPPEDVPKPEEHVFAFFREIKDSDNVSYHGYSKEFFDFNDINTRDEIAKGKLKELKKTIYNKLCPEDKNQPNNLHKSKVFCYETEWDGEGIVTEYLDDLCDDVYDSLAKIINKEIEKIEKIDEFEKEIQDHKDFGKERIKYFFGRTENLQNVEDYLEKREEEPLAIYGESGSGKTALMAYAAQKTHEIHPDIAIISRFIGATPSSSDIRSLLESLCHNISDIYGVERETIPTKYLELVDDFPMRLGLATPEKPLIIFLDALDQLSDFYDARNLTWLPTYLPENVHFILSTIPGECLDLVREMLPEDKIIELGAMQLEEGEIILDRWLNDASRKLEKQQKEEVIGKFSDNGLPLYLKLAFEEARRWKSYTNIDDTRLSNEISGIIGDMFTRLSKDSEHGNILVSKSLGFIEASRYGLSEDELIDLLSQENVLDDFKRRSPRSPKVDKLPVVVWSRLYSDLEPYLTEIRIGELSLLNFYHRQLSEVVKGKYLFKQNKKAFNLDLANYFETQTLNKRKADELPWQLDQAESWDRLKECITDLDFFGEIYDEDNFDLLNYWKDIDDKYDVIEEYEKAADKYESTLKSEKNYIEILTEMGEFFRLYGLYDGSAHFLNRAILLSEQIYGKEDKETSNLYYELGFTFFEKEDYTKAEKYYRKALEIIENNLENDDKKLSLILNNLAANLYKMDKLDESESLHKRGLKIREEQYGPDSIQVAGSLNNIAAVLKNKGEYKESEKFLLRSMEIFKKNYGMENPYTTTLMVNLGVLYYEMENFTEAEKLFRSALLIQEKVLRENPLMIGSLEGLSAILAEKKDFEEAERLSKRVLNLIEKYFGLNSLSYINTLSNYSLLLLDKGDLDGAEKSARKSLKISKNWNYEHSLTSQCYQNLAIIMDEKGDLEASERLYRTSLDILDGIYGSKSPDHAFCLINLGNLLIKKRKLDDAEHFLKRALDNSRQFFGNDHEYTSEIRELCQILQNR